MAPPEPTKRYLTEEQQQRAAAAERAAFDEEVKRLEEEIAQRVTGLVVHWVAREADVRDKETQAAEKERERQEKTLRNKEQEVLRQLQVERRKAEDMERRAEEERKRREDEERRRQEEERQRRLEEEEEQRKLQRDEQIKELLVTGEKALRQRELDSALARVTEALTLDPGNAEAKALEERIRRVIERIEQQRAQDEAAAATAALKAAEHAHKRNRSGRVVRARIFAAIGLLLFGLLVMMIVRSYYSKGFPQSVRIAVVPWTVTSSPASEQFLGASLAAEVSAQLQQISRIPVLGTPSVQTIRKGGDAVRKAFALGFPFVLQGSVSTGEGWYALQLTLIDSTYEVRWSRTLERTAADLPGAPGAIALRLAEAVGIEPDSLMEVTLGRVPTESPEAYLSYLRGTELLRRRTANDARPALALFEEALKNDPTFAAAGAAAAQAILRLEEVRKVPDAVLLARAETYGRDAVRADDLSVEAHTALGHALIERGSTKEALEHLDKALERAPHAAEALHWKGELLLKTGQFDDAVSSLTRAVSLSPRDERTLSLLAAAHQLRGMPVDGSLYFNAAAMTSDDSTAFITGPFGDILLYETGLLVNNGERIVAAFERYRSAHPGDYAASYRFARFLQAYGDGDRALKVLQQLRGALDRELGAAPQNARARIYQALVLTRLGEFPRSTSYALQALRQAKNDPEILYKAAQMFSIQMYSLKTNTIDSVKQAEALNALRSALTLDYRIEEMTSADFYNFRHSIEAYRNAIALPLK